MKRFQYFIQQRIRQACILMVATTALWACSQKHEITETRDTGQSQIVAQARAFYESNHKTLTKTVGEYDIHIKPLPGEIIPLWNQAVTALTNDGGSWVDVPLETALTYTAIRHAHHTHQEGVQCSHDTPVLATQKLSIYTAPDGTQQSYIVTLVPETETTAIDLNDFSSANGLIGFSGFASWHNLDGTLIRVAKYDNGHTTQSAEATDENNALSLKLWITHTLFLIKSHPLIPLSLSQKRALAIDATSAITQIVTHSMMDSIIAMYADNMTRKTNHHMNLTAYAPDVGHAGNAIREDFK